jgi:2-polyprenyl-3-methyl-5-hydroxy-6-metoxy-1,4-benzoquinol methylase
VDEDDFNYLTPLTGIAVDVVLPLEQLLAAYRSGAGVPFEAFGADLVDATGAINRPQFTHLIGERLSAVAEVDTRLRTTPAAHVGDVASGTAQFSIAIARAYPHVHVDAIDVDATSVDRARANLAAAGLDDRVRAVLHDASSGDLGGPYDLVTIFEALHDMNHP